MNAWRIPAWLEEEVRARDTRCVYCRVSMAERAPRGGPRKAAATWEHIINDATIVTREEHRPMLCGLQFEQGHEGARRLD